MQRNSNLYTFYFAGLVCAVCSIVVSTSAVTLRDRQERNRLIDKKTQVLSVAGLVEAGERISGDEVLNRFAERIQPVFVDLSTGALVEPEDLPPEISADDYDQRVAINNPELRIPAPPNPAGVRWLPRYAQVYLVEEDGALSKMVLPIEGMGLWGMMYGYLAMASDGEHIEGITFYQHAETPGLGGEVDNPRWKEQWPGRRAYDDEGNVAIRVIKGPAPDPEEAPHSVDGLSGATITSRGVTNALAFWLSEQAFKPFVENLSNERS